MRFHYSVAIFLIMTMSCNLAQEKPLLNGSFKITEQDFVKTLKSIGTIPLPGGYTRISYSPGSFGEWLRTVGLKKDKTVYLFDGRVKTNQTAQFAVLDISVGKKDLQQCADAVIRLRSEYLFEQKKYDELAFMEYSGKWYKWAGGNNRKKFDSYLENVFGWCGSASLEKQLGVVSDIENMQTGDVFVKGGFPGHAVIVADMAENDKGEKIYLLAQGYQPAQDIHVLNNPLDAEISPWYKLTSDESIITPEWVFYKSQLKRW